MERSEGEETYLWVVMRLQRWDECEVATNLHPALCPTVRWDQMPGIGFQAVFEDYAAAVEYAGNHALVRAIRLTEPAEETKARGEAG